MRPPILFTLFVVAAVLLPAAAIAQTCLFMDFDEDNDPWTIRTVLPPDIPSATVRFIIEVPPADGLANQWFWCEILEGCCNDPDNNGHYGAGIDAATLQYDSTLIDAHFESFPTCTFCCPWLIQAHFRDDAQLVPGQRYFFASGTARAICTEWDPPCYPPHDINVTFWLENGEQCLPNNTVQVMLACPPTAVPGGSWGRIRGLYR